MDDNQKKIFCDNCCKEIKPEDPCVFADNYDFGCDWIFCSEECFKLFNKIRIYEHLWEAMSKEYSIGV